MKLGYPIEGEPGKITKQNSQLSKIKIKIKINSNKKNEGQIYYKS
jgi:hypothetical protein